MTSAIAEIEIRPAGEADKTFGCRLIHDNMSPYYARYGMTWHLDQVTSVWAKTDNHVISVHGEPVGVLCLQAEPDTLSIRTILLNAAAQGQGAGSTAIAFAERPAREQRKPRLTLAVSLDNPARALYRRLGFQELRQEGNVMWAEKRLD